MEQIINQLNAIKERMQNEGQEAFESYFKKFLEENEQIHGITFTAYTPYFNDGETCVYRLGEVRFKLTHQALLDLNYPRPNDKYAKPEQLEDMEDWEYCGTVEYYDIKDISSELSAKMKKVSEDVESAEELIELVFGDHVELFITRDGVEVSEYEHD